MFMQPQITDRIEWVEVGGFGSESGAETVFVPASDYSEDMGEILSRETGHGYRLSAPGYLDCTDWGAADSVEDAKESLREMFCECDSEDELCELCQALEEIEE